MWLFSKVFFMEQMHCALGHIYLFSIPKTCLIFPTSAHILTPEWNFLPITFKHSTTLFQKACITKSKMQVLHLSSLSRTTPRAEGTSQFYRGSEGVLNPKRNVYSLSQMRSCISSIIGPWDVRDKFLKKHDQGNPGVHMQKA